MYAERKPEEREAYLQTLETISPEKRVFVDECGFDAPLIREYGYGSKGERVWGERTGKRFARTSLIAAWKQGKCLAPLEFKGYCDTEVVLTWVRECLIPELTRGDVVIWDNATFHKSPKIAQALEEAGMSLVFLPSYSPDLNPIERFWATLKAKLRELNLIALHISQALTQVFAKLFGNNHR